MDDFSTEMDPGASVESVAGTDQVADPTLVSETIDSSQGLLPFFEDLQSDGVEETIPVTGGYPAEMPYPETVSVAYMDFIKDCLWSSIHADLFGSFLVCGTLIGCALLRKVYGT